MNLLSLPAIAGAISLTSTSAIKFSAPPRSIAVQANFAYGSGGTTVDAWLQTSLDGGATWIDIAQFRFTTSAARYAYNLNSQTPVTTEYAATDGSLASNTAKDGLIGPQLRVKYQSAGTYAGATSLSIDIACDQACGA
jgi:hypothetical protein